MPEPSLDNLRAQISRGRAWREFGRITALTQNNATVAGLGHVAAIGDQVEICGRSGVHIRGEVLRLDKGVADVLPTESLDSVSVGDRVHLLGPIEIAPDDSWLGRLIDADGLPLDGCPLLAGTQPRSLAGSPPKASIRKALGERLECGLAAFNTALPIVRGQRIGLFAGSGVGKSTLVGQLARSIEADVVVIALIGERGREVRHFIEEVMGKDGMSRAVVVAATSDQSPVLRRRCAWTAMTVAEHFRAMGKHVLLFADSVTRFAEAHREVSLTLGESSSYGGYPPSVARNIMALAERAGPGEMGGAGDITAIFSVLVAGSDMEGLIADTLRGVLDGHVVLDRTIAERGRFPAIDLLASVSRSLPGAASATENALLKHLRRLLSVHSQTELMIRSGLYEKGSDPEVDSAVELWPQLDEFLGAQSPESIAESFDRLANILTAEG
ncbi:FliI/YscN family ATPase [Qingshengfaniella alkalisoli]|uniref:FliI/YscN family ATPase n=1 Tax=Qingshengfaniella alkalisoli TaxID=2599296 RepID=A0A5B8I8Q8_9RHOB|nr:FliI/YscN family ATPase [Qingshengfaniella alkalisoli]QDY70159.1 FliI/YscN family ATPase [Qingshengfaniella alkalisoli]